MPILINLTEVIEDDWIVVCDQDPIDNSDRLLLDRERLQRQWYLPELANRALGVRFEVTDTLADFQPYLDRLSLIALNFPQFSDGRAFSQARMLRKRFGYDGDLRAVGEVVIDQLAFMRRCGFNQFLLADNEPVELALESFSDISFSYQPDFKTYASG